MTSSLGFRITTDKERFVTIAGLIWSFSNLFLLMSYKHPCLYQDISTINALSWLLFCMESHMYCFFIFPSNSFYYLSSIWYFLIQFLLLLFKQYILHRYNSPRCVIACVLQEYFFLILYYNTSFWYLGRHNFSNIYCRVCFRMLWVPAVQCITHNHCTIRSFYAVDAEKLPIVSFLSTTKCEVNNFITFSPVNPITHVICWK